MEPLFLTPVDDPILRLTRNGYSKPFVNITDIDDFNINIPSVSRTAPRSHKGLNETEDFLQLSDIFGSSITDSGNFIEKEPSYVKHVLLEERSTDSEDPTPIIIVQEVEIEPDEDLECVQKITDSTETIEVKVEEEMKSQLPDSEDTVLVLEVEIEPDDLKSVQKITDSDETIEVKVEQNAECSESEYLPRKEENGLQKIDSRSLVQEVIHAGILIQPKQKEGRITDSSESEQPNLNSS